MRFSSRARGERSQWRIGELIRLELRLPYMLWRRMTDALRKRSGTALPVPLGEQPHLTSPVVAPAHARGLADKHWPPHEACKMGQRCFHSP